MSTPPPGSVYISPEVTGGVPYTGGAYIPQVPTPSWQYTPTHGTWPGTYDFTIRAPDNYYLQQQQLQPMPEIYVPDIRIPQR